MASGVWMVVAGARVAWAVAPWCYMCGEKWKGDDV